MENLSNNLPDVDRWAWLWFSMITISGCMAMTLCRVHTGAMGPCRVSDDHAYPGVPEDAASVARHIWHCSMNSLWLAPFVPWPECLGIFVASCVLYTVCRYRCPKKEMRIWFHNFCEFVFSDDSISNSQPSMSLWFGTQCIRITGFQTDNSMSKVYCDWDMLKTSEWHCHIHAVARAVAGCPVYVSDPAEDPRRDLWYACYELYNLNIMAVPVGTLQDLFHLLHGRLLGDDLSHLLYDQQCMRH